MRNFTSLVLTTAVLCGAQIASANTSIPDINSRGESFPGVYGASRTGEQILVARDYLPWGGDVVPYLTDNGAIVTVISTADISTVNLADYCLLFVECGTSEPGSITETNVNAALPAIESYLMTGGDVLYYTGTWGAVYNLPGGASSVYVYDDINTFCNPAHPIAAGVPDPFDGNWASHDYFVDVPANASCIMLDEGQNLTGVEYNMGQGHVVLMGQPVECYIVGGNCYQSGYPHFETLLDNSTLYATNCDTDFVEAEELPMGFNLAQNHPNPFNPVTNISFTLNETAELSLSVFDLQGREVAKLAEGLLEAGEHNVSFDASQLSSGVYFYTLKAGEQLATRKMTLLK